VSGAFDPEALREKYQTERDKRIRSDGHAQYVQVAGPSPSTSTIRTRQPSSAPH